MKVLHVYKDYPPVLGGIEGSLARLARGQAARGLDVTVLVTSPRGTSSANREDGVRVLRTGRWATVASTPLGPGLFRQLRRERPDVAHLHAPFPPGEVAQLLLGRSRAAVATHHSDIVRQRMLGLLYRGIQRRVFARMDRILVTSPPYLASSAALAAHRERCVVIPLGVDVARFADPDPAAVAAWRERLGSPLVLFVGRLRHYKGLSFLLRAMDEVPAVLAVVGRGVREARWRREAAGNDRIRFLGDVSEADLPALHRAADVFVLPSIARSEAYGLALLEAMAAGRPVVSTELGTGTSWLNRHGETGLVVPPRDAGALAAALRTLLADPERRRAFGAAAGRRAAGLSEDRWIDATVAVYREVLLSPARRAGSVGATR